MKTHCIIVPGCPDDAFDQTADKHRIPSILEDMSQQGLEAELVHMPSPRQPVYEAFCEQFQQYKIDENTILIGHSCGCSFLVRRLGEHKQWVAKLILVAPWKIYTWSDDIGKEFYDYDIDPTLKERIGKTTIFTSDDEEEEGKQSAILFRDALDGAVIELPGRGHYIESHMWTTQFPELLEVILS
jgi:predicted alpha/beta hydrolase family esterase